MKPSVTVVVVAFVVLAGCSQLAAPVDQPTSTTAGPIEGTISPTASQPSSAGTDGGVGTHATTTASTPTPPPTRKRTATATPTTPTTTATATATAIRSSTVTRTVPVTRTPARPPTATSTRPPTATPSPTATRTTTPTPKPARLVFASIDPENETVTLRNAGGRRLDLAGYVVDFDDGQRYTFPRYVLRPGASVTIHTGRGDDTRSALYAGFFYPVINHNSDTVLVETPNGRVVIGQRA